jgi:predicted Zn-dependent protease
MTLREAQARALIENALRFASADEVRVNLRAGRHANTRFARNAVTTNAETDSLVLSVTAAFGTRHATATGTESDDAALRRLVEKAEAMARLAPEDPEHVPELEPQSYLPIDPYCASTAIAGPGHRAEGARAAIEAAVAGGLVAAGYFEQNVSFDAVGNHKGLFAYSRSTSAEFNVTARTADGASSGWGGDNSRDITEVDCVRAAERAVRKAEAGREARPIAPEAYPVILEPQAVADFLEGLFWMMDARHADEGRSFFGKAGGGNKIGQPIVGENVTIRTDPTQRGLLAEPFGGDGQAARKHVWIEKGVLRELNYDRFWARKQGAEPTGPVGNAILDGGTGMVDDLIRGTERAVLVTRFWYIRVVDPQTILLTGLTRDGLFWVEGGESRHALRNLRFNESPMAALGRVTGMSAPVRVGNWLVPALRLSAFTFSSASDAV